MKRSLTCLPCIVILGVIAFGTAGDRGLAARSRDAGKVPHGLRLAADRKAELPVVVSGNASEGTKQVAAELAGYLSRVTGARFEVRAGDGARGIVLGTLAEFPHPDLAKGLEVRNTYDGREAYTIRTEPGRLLLLGATDLGASHAAFRFLEHLGCRWFFPAREWEVMPSWPVLTVRLDETDRPALLSRRIWYGFGHFDPKRGPEEHQVWARHNRMAASLKIKAGHAWQTIIQDNQNAFDAHPEYLALVKGQRRGPQFCVSNPEVRKIAARWALEQLRKQPEQDMVSMEPSDGPNQCECAACQKLGSVSDRVFGLANEVARLVASEYPGKMVGLYAYNDHCEPPSFDLEPNVYVQLTAGFNWGRYTFDELMELWPKRCRSMGIYEYLSFWPWDFDMPARGRAGNLKYLRERIPRYVRQGVTSLDCESGNNWGPHGLGYYVANRLMWDSKTDVDTLLADFFDKAFGPAAAVMRRCYERLDAGSEPLVSEHLLALALRDLEEATRLAGDRPDVLARLDHLKQYQHYVRLRWEHDRTTEKEHKRELALAALTHAYRARYTFMNHWQAMLQHWTPAAAKEFERPAWSFGDPSPDKPWKVEREYTREETERLFREGLARFRPQPIEEKTFSAELVPAGFRTERPAQTAQRFQKEARYALYSPKGDPLEVTVTTGVIASYRGGRPDAAYTITDTAGKEVARGRLPQDGTEHALRVEVPRPGLYWLDFHDQAAGWGIEATAGRPVVLALRRGSHPSHLGHMQRVFFYVPRGTRRVDYFWDGPPHEVLGPDGQLIAGVKDRGRFVTIAVPEGADGRVWSLLKLVPGHLWFFNVPNYLAASPDALLVPREVAEKDGLSSGTGGGVPPCQKQVGDTG